MQKHLYLISAFTSIMQGSTLSKIALVSTNLTPLLPGRGLSEKIPRHLPHADAGNSSPQTRPSLNTLTSPNSQNLHPASFLSVIRRYPLYIISSYIPPPQCAPFKSKNTLRCATHTYHLVLHYPQHDPRKRKPSYNNPY